METLKIICFIVWLVTFIPGTYLEFKYPPAEVYKKQVVGATLRLISSLVLLAMLFMR